MKVLHITAIAEGGAGIACSRQHTALREAGVDSKVLLLRGNVNAQNGFYSVETSDPDFSKTLWQYKRQRALLNVKVRLNGKTPELFSPAHSVWKIEEHPLVKEADIIHLHWVAGMIDLPRFFSVVKKPIVWTIHDAWAYTGGFHYERYWDSARFAKLSAEGLAIRKEIFSDRAIHIVSPSEYLLNECRNSGVFAKSEFHHIRNCITYTHMRTADENIPAHVSCRTQQWLFCCDELDYYRKGADLLFDAFLQWKNPSVQLIIAGKPGKKKLPDDPRIRFTGHVSSLEIIKLMCKSDALIHPSREDNQPNAIVEALCIGTPVLATPVGGVPEMIRNHENGILTKNCTVESLVQGFDEMFRMKTDHEEIAKEAIRIYFPKPFTDAMRALYAKLEL